MTSNFSDDAVRRELGEYSNGGNSMAHQLNSPVGELPRSQVNADPHPATSMTAQIACEDTEMVYEDLGDEESWALVKDHAEFNVADYINEDRNGISAAPHPTIISSYENTQDSSRNHEPLNSFPIGGSPLYMLGTSDGVLNNNYAMDDLTTLTRKYGVFPFIRKNARPSIGFDGTLIHSSMRDEGADFSFILLRGAEESTVYVKKRPYVDAFLKKVAEMFDIVVFTASISSYADQLLDILDPGRLISGRYYRDSCLSLGGKYLKDLTIIEANLMKVAIIDNTPEVFRLQVNNGIPINTWSSDPYDTSLLELIPFLETLSVAKDQWRMLVKWKDRGLVDAAMDTLRHLHAELAELAASTVP
ncbi:hypothetical protein QYE76_015484 [Lolium multiflorum]|uniref:FCP1 homology domain-containing protein n=1 Tax=Lolium multiflorum TaxID=4521 RepID=A0AAD8U726_LOLMU|nr:hypothetical protein QYE76_015484 [Lolium multiflorum]